LQVKKSARLSVGKFRAKQEDKQASILLIYRYAESQVKLLLQKIIQSFILKRVKYRVPTGGKQ